MGRMIMFLGLGLLLLGAAMTWAPWLLGWFGRLPGDIRVERPSGVLVIPLTSMVLVSIALTLLVNLFFRR